MGYQVVEFFAPYFSWTPDYAKQVRKILDDPGIRCNSTHNGPPSFAADGLKKATELNQIIGAKFIVMASAGRITWLDGWKQLAEHPGARLGDAAAHGAPLGLSQPPTGVHPARGQAAHGSDRRQYAQGFHAAARRGHLRGGRLRPGGVDQANPGRINSLHLKDWAPGAGKGYSVLFGEGVVPWKGVMEAAERVGGVEYYLIEQEGSRVPAPGNGAALPGSLEEDARVRADPCGTRCPGVL